jgi:hypothetical protein
MRHLRTALIGLASAAVAAVSVIVPMTSADAATNRVQITYVNYNAPGADTASNTSVNGEVVRITNKGTTAKYLTGWTLRDIQGHVYKFPATKLNPGKSLLVYTGRGLNTVAKRYWGMRYHVWNNGGDKAVLRTATGVLADTCAWSSAGRGYTYC